MTDREHIIELCHDLANRALRLEIEADGHDFPNYTNDYRAKEQALRRILAVYDAAVDFINLQRTIL